MAFFEFHDGSSATIGEYATFVSVRPWRLHVAAQADRYAAEHKVWEFWRHEAGMDSRPEYERRFVDANSCFGHLHGTAAERFLTHMHHLRARHRKTVCDDARAVLNAAEAAEAGTTWLVDDSGRLVVSKGATTLTYTGLSAWHKDRERFRLLLAGVRDLVIEPDDRTYHSARDAAQVALWRTEVFGGAVRQVNRGEKALKDESERHLTEFVGAL